MNSFYKKPGIYCPAGQSAKLLAICIAAIMTGLPATAQNSPTLPPPPPPVDGDPSGAPAAAPAAAPETATAPAVPANVPGGAPSSAATDGPPPVEMPEAADTAASGSTGSAPASSQPAAPAQPPKPTRAKPASKKPKAATNGFRDSAKTEPLLPQEPVQPVKDTPKATTVESATGETVGKVEIPSEGKEKRGSSSIPAGQELINIDFPEPTEIKDIIKAVALWTNKNVILDRNVSGKVQIISPRKVTKEEAYQAFLSALNLLGMTTVETGKVIKIMPVRTAVKDNLKTFLGSKWTLLTDEIITQIVPLKYIDAKEIQNTLSRIVSSNSMIAYEKTNTLIISDSGYKVRRILDILELLDVQGQQPQVSIVPIRYADAKSIVDKVNELMKAGAGRGQPAYKLLTDERANSVIIFGPPRTISDVKALVRKFDSPIDDPTKQSTIHVRPLDYADAKKLASTLSSLAQGNRGGTRRITPLRPQAAAPGAPTGTGAAIEGAAVAELDEGTKITADEQSNSLLITGSRAAYNAVNSIVRKLDIRRSQVFVEADILDINVDNRFRFGTSIFGGRGGEAGSKIITTWEAKSMGPLVAAQASGSAGSSAAAIEKVAGAFAEDMTIGVLAGTSVNVPGLGDFTPGALIKLIKADSNTRVLSSPHILTANNEEAKITVGEKIFYESAEFNAQTGVAVPKVEKEDVDLTLGLKPNISNANFVTMKVDLESASVQFDSQSGLPKINKRKTSQVLTVKNAQTVVVSGLVQATEFETFQKIPLLGDIPIIGWLFRNSSTGSVRNNLVIFLTPHIIHGPDDLAAVYAKKVHERDEFMQQVYGSRFKKDDFYALLPKAADGENKKDEPKPADQESPAVDGDVEDEQKPGGEDAENAANDAVDGNDTQQQNSIPVPFFGGGESGSGGSVDSGSTPLPPPPPPPAAMPEPMEGGTFEPPPPMEQPPIN
jgi:general secretion pathway protein D